MKNLLPFLLFITGCTFVPRATMEMGYIDWDISLSDEINTRGDPNPMNGLQGSIRLEADMIEIGPVVVDVGVGPKVATSFDHAGEIYGAEIASRIRVKVTDWLEPYFIHCHSADYFEHTWEPEEVRYGFTTQFGAGTRIIIDERWSVNVDYRWWHNSWAKSFYSDEMRDFFGLEKKGPNRGFEAGSIFIGVSYDF